jgi:hypothetical protein
VHAVLRARERHHAAQRDDRPVAPFHHRGQARLDAMKRRVERDRHDAPPFLEAHLGDMRLLANRGIEHQDIDASEALGDALHHRIDRGRVGHVRDIARCLAARFGDLRDDLVAIRLRRARIDGHGSPRVRERARDRASDVLGRAGHQRDLAFEIGAALKRGFSYGHLRVLVVIERMSADVTNTFAFTLGSVRLQPKNTDGLPFQCC